jgi:putative pyruvate formate lyase activating enzyme
VLVRHLVMPGRLGETREIVGWLAGLSRDTYLNLMDQYYPAWKLPEPDGPVLPRP